MLLAGALLGSGVVVLTGCGLQNIGRPENQSVNSYDVANVTKLEVRSGAGDVVVNETGGTGVRVTETLHWRGDGKPETAHPVEGDQLTLSYDCPEKIGFHSCAVDYKVEVPKGVAVTVDTGSGEITLRQLTGPVTAKTGSGDIRAAGLGGKSAYAETGAGDIDLKFVTAPDDVTLESGAGDAVVRLPDGTYAVTTESGAGEGRTEVTDDDQSPRKIKVSTGAGDASVLKATS
ncbi:hypothetical protein GCM10023259_033930 [Thermocatellispora tengchongensis]